MSTNKKIIAVVLAVVATLAIAFAMTGCGEQKSDPTNGKYSGQTITGEIQEINGDEITLVLGTVEEMVVDEEIAGEEISGDAEETTIASRMVPAKDGEDEDMSPNEWENPNDDADYESEPGSALEGTPKNESAPNGYYWAITEQSTPQVFKAYDDECYTFVIKGASMTSYAGNEISAGYLKVGDVVTVEIGDANIVKTLKTVNVVVNV